MFDIGATELLLIFIVAVIVIGRDDMPLALRTFGRWVGKLRRLSSQFRAGLDSVVREAELEDMEKQWKAQNERIMREHPEGVPTEMEPTGAYPAKIAAPQQSPAQKAEELKIVAAKQKAAAEEAERLAAEAEAEAEAEATAGTGAESAQEQLPLGDAASDAKAKEV